MRSLQVYASLEALWQLTARAAKRAALELELGERHASAATRGYITPFDKRRGELAF